MLERNQINLNYKVSYFWKLLTLLKICITLEVS